MKIVRILDYLLVVFIIGLFWLISHRADAQLQAMFEKPDPTIEHRTIASANEEIAYLRATQSDLLSLHHQAHVRFSWAAILVLFAALPLRQLFRKSEEKPNHPPEPTRG